MYINYILINWKIYQLVWKRLKSKVDTLDVDKLVPIPVGLV